ncbi:hypothetical protein [Streptosporangium sp. NPDC001681]|uniref:hypothetical protein n=1 Tax=Streptosporangium sp. NPDC001681 TaxID=3154395 RepID=UPI003325971E
MTWSFSLLCGWSHGPEWRADNGDPVERLAFAGLREVRHTIIRVTATHLREEATTSWQGHNFDFTGVVFDGGDFGDAWLSGGMVDFRKVRDWSHPPGLPNPVPTGVLLLDRLSTATLEASTAGRPSPDLLVLRSFLSGKIRRTIRAPWALDGR